MTATNVQLSQFALRNSQYTHFSACSCYHWNSLTTMEQPYGSIFHQENSFAGQWYFLPVFSFPKSLHLMIFSAHILLGKGYNINIKGAVHQTRFRRLSHYHTSSVPASWVAKKVINLIHTEQLAWHASLPRDEHGIQLTKSSWHSRRPHFSFISIQQRLHFMAASMDCLCSPLLLLSLHHSKVKRFSLYQPRELLHPVYFLGLLCRSFSIQHVYSPLCPGLQSTQQLGLGCHCCSGYSYCAWYSGKVIKHISNY